MLVQAKLNSYRHMIRKRELVQLCHVTDTVSVILLLLSQKNIYEVHAYDLSNVEKVVSAALELLA